MSSDNAHRVLHDHRDYGHGAHVCDVHAFHVHAYEDLHYSHVYDWINHVYAGDDQVNLHVYDNYAISHGKLHFLRFLPCPYLDV